MIAPLLLLLVACGGGSPGPARIEGADQHAPAALPETFGLGRTPTPEEIAALDVEVSATWAGLPPGSGSAAEGKKLYAQKCAACHAPDLNGGDGWMGPKLVATEPLEGFEKDWKATRSIGNWWPHASTLWDYVHRSMPQTAPGSLTADETYALVAFLLAENKAVPADFVADQDAIRAVKMPTRTRFVPDDRETTPEFR